MTPDIAHHFLVLTYVSLALIFAIVAMRTFAASRRGRRHAQTDSHVQNELAAIENRLASVEALLREVG